MTSRAICTNHTISELRRYAHLSPDDGVCLMELVAVLAGGAFCDRPTCTTRC